MLTSSDAKFRCLWHMFIWSVLLTLSSQLYSFFDHIAFYVLGALCIFFLPLNTALYSNSSGNRGASLLRVTYVLCDPVMACVALVPVLFVRRVTPVIMQLHCLSVANNYNYDNQFLYLSQYPPINNTNYYQPNNSWLLYHNIINNNNNNNNINLNNNYNEDHHHEDSARITDYNATLECIRATPLIGHHNLLSTILRTAGGVSHDDEHREHDNEEDDNNNNNFGGYDNEYVRRIFDSLPFNLNTVLWLERKQLLTGIELSCMFPCVLALLMGRRTRKMKSQTRIILFAYWLVVAIECCEMVESSTRLDKSTLHYVITTQVTVVVASILANSYALVTLCSYISPMRCKGDKEEVAGHFDIIYKAIVGSIAVLFVEFPQLVVRMQIIISIISSQHFSNTLLHQARSYLAYSAAVAHSHSNATAFQVTTKPTSKLQFGNNIIDNIKLLIQNIANTSATNTLFPPKQRLSPLQPSTPTSPSTPPPLLPSSSSPYISHFLFSPGMLLEQTSLPPSFYLWTFKNICMIITIVTLLILYRLKRGTPKIIKKLAEQEGCVGVFDNLDALFIPEKRDRYILYKKSRDGQERKPYRRKYKSITKQDSNNNNNDKCSTSDIDNDIPFKQKMYINNNYRSRMDKIVQNNENSKNDISEENYEPKPSTSSSPLSSVKPPSSSLLINLTSKYEEGEEEDDGLRNKTDDFKAVKKDHTRYNAAINNNNLNNSKNDDNNNEKKEKKSVKFNFS